MKVFSVTQVTSYLKNLLSDDMILSGLFVQGEITNCKTSNGHVYFSIKDEKSVINCVLFKNTAQALCFRLEDGMNILVYGYISIYEKIGSYQLYAQDIEPIGKGKAFLLFEQLKNKLSEEGLFETKHKKPIPEFAQNIAIITSPEGAVIKDILTVTKSKNPYANLTLFGVNVQGENSIKSIVNAIKYANILNKFDVIILARGGGAFEDFNAFNSEEVARAIFASNIPLISACGHETDFSISDYVADLRAATPSVAAEIANFDIYATKELLEDYRNLMLKTLNDKVQHNKIILDNLYKRKSLTRFLDKIYLKQMYLDKLKKDQLQILQYKIINNKMELEILYNKLLVMQNQIDKGYVLIFDENGNVIKSAKKAIEQNILSIQFIDGTVSVKLLAQELENE